MVRDYRERHSKKDGIKVVTSTAKSDHKAIIAYNDKPVKLHEKKKEERLIRRKTPTQNAIFLNHLPTVEFDVCEMSDKPQEEFDKFYVTALQLLNQFYPVNKITISDRDPDYVTGEIKWKLKRKNKLMRQGRLEEAGALARRIGLDIIHNNAIQLKKVNHKIDAKAMWRTVNNLTKSGRKNNECAFGVSEADLNEHYAKISTDNNYTAPQRKSTATDNQNPFTEFEIFRILDGLKSTATGLDELPAWFLRLGAPVLAKPISKIFNISLKSSVVPEQWKKAYIRPIPKIKSPLAPSDFRPISITPVLSRILEKLVVQRYVYPAFLDPPTSLDFTDQFAFRPTGSTTAAVISILQTITDMLKTNQYVVMYSIDFSKAFDTVRHSALLEKYALLKIPDHIYNWLVDFFRGHSHCTVFAGKTSSFLQINGSIIQGSVIGPGSFVVTASDKRPLNPGNIIEKFADDMYPIIPESNVDTRLDELSDFDVWAETNNLKVNRSKCAEIIFTKPRGRSSITLPPLVPGIERVKKMKILGVTICDDLSVSEHINSSLVSCSQTMYALKILRARGMNPGDLHEVFRSVVIGKISYASPAWWGYANAQDKERIESFLRKSKHYGFQPENSASFSALCDAADDRLMRAIAMADYHVLRQNNLVQLKPPNAYNMRDRKHNFSLPKKSNHLDECNFSSRILYKDIY